MNEFEIKLIEKLSIIGTHLEEISGRLSNFDKPLSELTSIATSIEDTKESIAEINCNIADLRNMEKCNHMDGSTVGKDCDWCRV